MQIGKSYQEFAALAGMFIYIFNSTSEGSIIQRVSMTSGSILLSYAVATDISIWSGIPELLTFVGVGIFGYLILDVARSLVSDRDFIKSALSGWLDRKK